MEWPEGYKLNYYPSINSSSANISFTKKGGWFEIEGNVQISEWTGCVAPEVARTNATE